MNKQYKWNLFSTYRSELMCVSIIGILFCHILTNAAEHGITDYSLFMKITMLGSCFVDAFLFLSGIGLYYSFSKNQSVGKFYKRRYIRLFIPYVIVAIPTGVFLSIKNGTGILDMIKYLTGVSLFTTGNTFAWFVVAIAILYFVFPIIYRKIFKGHHEFFKTVILCAIIIALTYLMCIINYQLFLNIDIALMRIPIFIVGIYCGRLSKEEKVIDNGLLMGLFFVGSITLILRMIGKIPSFLSYYHVSVLGVFLITIAALILDFTMKYKIGQCIGIFLKMGGGTRLNCIYVI